MEGPEEVLVTQFSAVHCRHWEIGAEHVSAISRNHSEMVKFKAEDEEYAKVCGIIKAFAKRAKIRKPVHSIESR